MSTLRDNGPSWRDPPGPHRADQIREGDLVELSNGHAIQCMNAGRRHGGAHFAGALAIGTATRLDLGIDVGVEWNEGKNLRSPDLIAGLELDRPGWATEAPPLAVEYADSGQNEGELRKKIGELLEFGTRVVWVVRLVGPLRVEVHEPGLPARVVDADGQLTAPGILDETVPVRALIDPRHARAAALHNLLAGEGYRDLEAVREEAREQAHDAGVAATQRQMRDGLQTLLVTRGWSLTPAVIARIDACDDTMTLVRWLTQAPVARDLDAALR